MVLLNVLVALKANNKVVLGWEIVKCIHPEDAFQPLFDGKLSSRISDSESPLHLDSCFVGKEKHALDKTDPSLPVVEVVSVFGHFVKIFVSEATDDLGTLSSSTTTPRSAFDVMMLAQRSLNVAVVPHHIPVYYNRKGSSFSSTITRWWQTVHSKECQKRKLVSNYLYKSHTLLRTNREAIL